MDIEYFKKPFGCLINKDLNSFVALEPESHLHPDQSRGSLKQTTTKPDGTVVIHRSDFSLPEIFGQFPRCPTEGFGIPLIPFKRCLIGGTMFSGVIGVLDVITESFVQFFEGKLFRQFDQELPPDRPKIPLNLTFSLRPVWPGVGEANLERGTSNLEPVRTKRGAIIHIQFPRHPSLTKCNPEAVQITLDVFLQVELTMGNQPAVVVNEGKEIALSALSFMNNLRPMHTVGLPKVV